ncbi:MAG: 4-(cytidine 5-diphospho)-2-C-methyl-D-erythritol kinase [Actinomycetota bacterium]
MIYASAPGKLNLFFEVGPLRSDGYHSVISVYQALAIRQRVGVEPYSKWEVITRGDLPQQQLDLVPRDEKNLCVVAAKALADYAGISNPQPMCFHTHKQVPVAAGLAGGSADAAASLIALNEAWCLGLSNDQLQEVASKVGSDVPFSLLGGTALGLDTGINLKPLNNLNELHIVLLISPIGLSTKEVFGKFDQMYPQGDITVDPADAANAVLAGKRIGKNSLLEPALALRPELADYQSLLTETKGYLSGSGPTIYFATEDASQAAAWSSQLTSLGHLVIQTTTSRRGANLE